MNPPPPGLALPKGVRRASIFCLILSSVVGVISTTEVLSLNRLAEVRDRPVPSFGLDPEVFRRQASAEIQALEEMQGPRAVILTFLAIFAGLSFVGAARMLRPGGVSRETGRRLLAGTALGCAIFRTLDGAQLAVVSRRAAVAAVDAFSKSPSMPNPELTPFYQAILPAATLFFSIGLTVVMAGSFLLLSQYFRSKQVREFAAREDSV